MWCLYRLFFCCVPRCHSCFFCFQMYVFIFHSPKWHPFHHCLQPRDVPSKTHEASRKNVSYGPRKASTFGRRRRDQPGAHWVGGSWWKLIEGPKSWLSRLAIVNVRRIPGWIHRKMMVKDFHLTIFHHMRIRVMFQWRRVNELRPHCSILHSFVGFSKWGLLSMFSIILGFGASAKF